MFPPKHTQIFAFPFLTYATALNLEMHELLIFSFPAFLPLFFSV